MQSNKIQQVFQWVSLFSTYVSSTCFGPHRSIIRSVLYKLYSQIWYVVILCVLLDTSSRNGWTCRVVLHIQNFIERGRCELSSLSSLIVCNNVRSSVKQYFFYRYRLIVFYRTQQRTFSIPFLISLLPYSLFHISFYQPARVRCTVCAKTYTSLKELEGYSNLCFCCWSDE